MFLYDRARRRARWGRVVPLVVLSVLAGIGAAFGLATMELVPRWAVTPLGNSLGLMAVWMWLPNAVLPPRRFALRTRLLAGVASALILVWAMIAASWQDPFWLR